MIAWLEHWFDFDDATYLNSASEGLMPRVAIQAAGLAVDAKTFPHRVTQSSFFEVTDRLRASIANLIGGRPEVALTTGASAGTAILAGRRFHDRGRLQVAAQPLWHRFLLVPAEAPRDAAAGAVLLDGHGRRERLQRAAFR